MPTLVFAEDLSSLPSEITSAEGIKINNYSSKYIGYTEGTYETFSIDPSVFNGLYIDGPISFTLNEDKTIYNVKAYRNSEKTDYIIIPIEINKPGFEEQSTVLKDLEVVGYDLKYNSVLNDFKLTVSSDIDEVYINPTVSGNLTYVNGAGVVKLDKKTTEVELEVINPLIQESNIYKITIVKKNKIISVVIICIVIFALLIGILLFLFKRYQDKFSHVDPNILKSKVKEIDVEEIIKQNAEKKPENINDVSNETITPGVLTPRTLIPEEDKK